jgi:hypothetical protein
MMMAETDTSALAPIDDSNKSSSSSNDHSGNDKRPKAVMTANKEDDNAGIYDHHSATPASGSE